MQVAGACTAPLFNLIWKPIQPGLASQFQWQDVPVLDKAPVSAIGAENNSARAGTRWFAAERPKERPSQRTAGERPGNPDVFPKKIWLWNEDSTACRLHLTADPCAYDFLDRQAQQTHMCLQLPSSSTRCKLCT